MIFKSAPVLKFLACPLRLPRGIRAISHIANKRDKIRWRYGQPILQPVASVTVSKGEAPAAKPARTFREFGLREDLLKSLKEMGIEEPTEIQAQAVKELLLASADSSFFLASHTGSGKTLAYLLPLIQTLKNEEDAAAAAAAAPGGAAEAHVTPVTTLPNRPRALVLGPTRELTDQIHDVLKTLSVNAKVRSCVINAGKLRKAQKTMLEKPNDIVVATPSAVLANSKEQNLYFSDVRHVILDEADTMFDEGFGPDVVELLKICRRKSKPARFVLVSATLRKEVQRLIAEELPEMQKIATTSLHRGVVGATHDFRVVPPGGDKVNLLQEVLEPELERGKRVLIFCNTVASCRAIDYALQDRGIEALQYHGEMPIEARRENFARFVRRIQGTEEAADAAEETSTSGRPPGGGLKGGPPAVLMCTDIAARGLDFKGQIDLVINFDFPKNAVDYLHRTGRTARAGAKGRVTSLITKPDRVLGARIEYALKHGEALDQLSSDKRILPPSQRPDPEKAKKKFEEERRARKLSRQGGGRDRDRERSYGGGPGGDRDRQRGDRLDYAGRGRSAGPGGPRGAGAGGERREGGDRGESQGSGFPSGGPKRFSR